ncbi:hypothetical protein ACFLZB_02675 [Nanoarchaeota archaeon]
MEKKCRQCGKSQAFVYLGILICSKCFVRLIEKRVKRSLGKVFSKNDKVLVVGDLADYFVSLIMEGFPIKIVKRKKLSGSLAGFDKVVVESTMDDIDAGFLSEFFSKKIDLKKNKKIIRILQTVTDEEALKFAKIKKISFKVDDKNKVIKEFLGKISKKHPEVRYNLLKNVKEVEGFLE